MKKRFLACILMVIMLFTIMTPETVSADTGPKPSVTLDFKGLEEETYYVTLLSETEVSGPWRVDGEFRDLPGDKNVWEKFKAYEDVDGFHFLGCGGECSENDSFAWTYYPPETFKILIYFPEYDKFIISEKTYEKYAFDSYYTVTVSSDDVMSVEALEEAAVAKTYDFKWEAVSLVCRIVITILIEAAIAWLFGFRQKKQMQLIFITNIATQTILNVLLNVINYKQGALIFVLNYIWMELAVFVIEGLVFTRFLQKKETAGNKKTSPWLYAAAANSVSFILGMVLAKYIPGIF